MLRFLDHKLPAATKAIIMVRIALIKIKAVLKQCMETICFLLIRVIKQGEKCKVKKVKLFLINPGKLRMEAEIRNPNSIMESEKLNPRGKIS